MERETVAGLSTAGIRRTQGGGSAIRSQRSQRRARERALDLLAKEFKRKTGVFASSPEGRAHPDFEDFARRAASIQRQVLIA